MRHFALSALLLCPKKQSTVENGSIQNYRMSLARIRDVHRWVGGKNQQIDPSPRLD